MARLKKPADERLFMLIKNWLGVYLPTERKASPCTIANYRQALNQFLTYLAERNGTKLAAVTFDMMNADSLNAYLNTEHKRKAIEKAMEHSRLTTELSASNGQPAYKITDEDLLKRLYGLD